MVLPFARHTADGFIPLVLRGSLAHATDLDVQQAAVEANPMRLLVRQGCAQCAYVWQAPKQGCCPQCGHESFFIESVPCMAARI